MKEYNLSLRESSGTLSVRTDSLSSFSLCKYPFFLFLSLSTHGSTYLSRGIMCIILQKKRKKTRTIDARAKKCRTRPNVFYTRSAKKSAFLQCMGSKVKIIRVFYCSFVGKKGGRRKKTHNCRKMCEPKNNTFPTQAKFLNIRQTNTSINWNVIEFFSVSKFDSKIEKLTFLSVLQFHKFLNFWALIAFFFFFGFLKKFLIFIFLSS